MQSPHDPDLSDLCSSGHDCAGLHKPYWPEIGQDGRCSYCHAEAQYNALISVLPATDDVTDTRRREIESLLDALEVGGRELVEALWRKQCARRVA